MPQLLRCLTTRFSAQEAPKDTQVPRLKDAWSSVSSSDFGGECLQWNEE